MLFSAVTFTLVVINSGILLLSFVLLIECLASLFAQERFSVEEVKEDTLITVLMPAHNEELVIADTLQTIIPQLKPQDRLIVIADNCSDRTAQIATEMGVEVQERENQQQRGKGYALDFGLQCLQDEPPEVVILIDADSIVHPHTITRLTQEAIAYRQPIQALYLMETPEISTPKHQISAFAFKVKNLVRPLGLKQLGQPCLLTGTGMAFPWQVINQINLASSNIVEDMKLGIDLAIAGYPPRFCQSAQVTGCLPQNQEAKATQRKRWEHGHLQIALTYVPLLLKAAINKQKLSLLTLALDIAIPPLSLFVFLWLGFAFASLLTFIFLNAQVPLIVSIIGGLMLISAIFTAWLKFGREDLSLLSLIKVPLYILWKIPIYFKFLGQKESQWIRTQRDEK